MKKYVIARYTAELRYKPTPGDVRDVGDMSPEWEEYATLDEAQKAVGDNPFRYINHIEEKRGTAGTYYDCDEYAIEEWELDDDGEMICSTLCSLICVETAEPKKIVASWSVV